jgi:hypothetical protein
MPNSVLATISKPRASSSDVARQWLVTFGEICGREITPALAAIWADQLGDIAPDLLHQACDQLAKTWSSNFMPTPGSVRAQITQANAKGFELAAESEWQRLLAWVRENVFPDTGIRRGAPSLTPAVEHAAKAAGGIYFIERCSDDQLVWCRKTFLAALKNVHETGQVEHFLGDGDAKGILARLVAGPESPKQIVSPPEDAEGALPPRAEVRALLERIAEIPSEEEWERRKRDLKRRANEWATSHGHSVEPSEQAIEVCP